MLKIGGGKKKKKKKKGDESEMSEIDTKYLRDKNVAALLESIAAEIVIQKPSDPEAFLRERFAGESEELFKPNDAVSIFVKMLDPASVCALIACAYAKIPCQLQVTEVGEGLPIPSDFSAASPFGSTPALDHNGLGLVEVGSVLRYLCGRTPAFPSNATRLRAKIDAACDAVQNAVLSEAIVAVNERVFLPRKHQRPVDNMSVQASATKFRALLNQLQHSHSNLFFEESQWLVGQVPTIADFVLAGAIFSMHHVAGYDCVTGFEKLQKWWAAIQLEPYYQEGVKSFVAAAAKIHSR